MLESLDLLIGLVVIVLALSMAVTVVTQAVTTMINSRGRHLRRGLTDLLQQLDPSLDAAISKAIATAVLTNPLVSGSEIPVVGAALGGPRLGNVIHRDEFTKLLMSLAAGGRTQALDDAAVKALRAALANNGVHDPADTLARVRALALQIERSAPDLASSARQTMAMLEATQSDLLAKINGWFDQTMDRTSQRFTASTRSITFAGAFVIAFGLQVDMPAVVDRLAADDRLQAALVADAERVYAARAATEGQSPAAFDQRSRELLASAGIIRLPSLSRSYVDGYTGSSVLGMLITALLLSLGAPFWYGALGQLLQLRSSLAAKDDAQRAQRQTDTPVRQGDG